MLILDPPMKKWMIDSIFMWQKLQKIKENLSQAIKYLNYKL